MLTDEFKVSHFKWLYFSETQTVYSDEFKNVDDPETITLVVDASELRLGYSNIPCV